LFCWKDNTAQEVGMFLRTLKQLVEWDGIESFSQIKYSYDISLKNIILECGKSINSGVTLCKTICLFERFSSISETRTLLIDCSTIFLKKGRREIGR
jgi:hypothetical protein